MHDHTTFTSLCDSILVLMSYADTDAWSDNTFNQLAMTLFEFQFEMNIPYRRFCENRHHLPGSIQSWQDIPAVPTDAFKHFRLAVGPSRADIATFRTSGTTIALRGAHSFQTFDLYNAALAYSFRRYLLPDAPSLAFVSLIPPFEVAPDSSLSYMVNKVMKFGNLYSTSLCDSTGFSPPAVWDLLTQLAATNVPVLVLGTAFSFVHLFDTCSDRSVILAPASRLMETGGLKGRAREVSKRDLYQMFEQRFGIPSRYSISEYGMTELSSQLYDNALFTKCQKIEKIRGLEPPPWLKVRIIDPHSGTGLPDGEMGAVQFFDLANVGSVAAIQTADLGMLEAGVLTLLGRIPGVAPRGCSLSTEELLKMEPSHA